jgi:predicted LPLAT superfamily acyltransferase
MSRIWLQKDERGSACLLRLLAWIVLRLPRGLGRLFLIPITLYFVIWAKGSRHASRYYLSKVLPYSPTWRDIYSHHFAFAQVVLDRIYLLAGRYAYFEISHQSTGREAVMQLLQKGKGCILLGAHLGSFEVLRCSSMLNLEIPLNILMYSANAAKTNAIFNAVNPKLLPQIIELGQADAMLKAQECLLRGEVLGILGDRVYAEDKVLACEFLGEPALFPKGPFMLASALKAPVALFFGTYQGGNRYTIDLEVFSEGISIPRAEREAGLQAYLQQYAHRLAAQCKKSPYNWFNFYDYWKK